jgi:hypothetical protein
MHCRKFRDIRRCFQPVGSGVLELEVKLNASRFATILAVRVTGLSAEGYGWRSIGRNNNRY